MMGNNGQLIYDAVGASKALECLFDMRTLENTPKFGKLKNEYPLTSRYTVEDGSKAIDSSFYTDKSASTLLFAIRLFDDDLSSLHQSITGKYWEYIEGIHDLTNNSKGELGNFEGDSSIFDLNLFEEDKLYLYYSGFEITNQDYQDYIISDLSYVDIAEKPNMATIKKQKL